MEKARIFEHLESGARAAVMEHLDVRDVCPRCQSDLSPRVIDSWRAGRRIHCTRCDWTGTWRTNTILSRSVLSCAQFLLLNVLFANGCQDNRQIASFVGVHQDTVRSWRRWYDQTQGGA